MADHDAKAELLQEEDAQKILKSCPVKMKSITSFFKSNQIAETTVSNSDSIGGDNVKCTKLASCNKTKECEKGKTLSNGVTGSTKNSEVEVSYDEFVQHVGFKESSLKSPSSKTEVGSGLTLSKNVKNGDSLHVSYESFLTKYEQEGNVIGESAVHTKETCSGNDQAKNESVCKNLFSKSLCNKAKEGSTCSDNPKDDSPAQEETVEGVNEPIRPVTGKASILSFFQKTDKKTCDVANNCKTDDVIITKVEAQIHHEPASKKNDVHDQSEKAFSIFDTSKWKTGLEKFKSNVCVLSTEVDMEITVLETIDPDAESKKGDEDDANDGEEKKDEDSEEIVRNIEKKSLQKAKEEHKKGIKSQMEALDKIKVSSKKKNTQATLPFGGKAVAGKVIKGKTKNGVQKSNTDQAKGKANSQVKVKGIKTKKQAVKEDVKTPTGKKKSSCVKTPTARSSQSDEFTPNSKQTLDGKPKLRKSKFCGECPACQNEDCAKCVYCLDKPKFGGPNTKKQKCLKRRCEKFLTLALAPPEIKPAKKIKKIDRSKQLLQKAKKGRKSIPVSPVKLSPVKKRKMTKECPRKDNSNTSKNERGKGNRRSRTRTEDSNSDEKENVERSTWAQQMLARAKGAKPQPGQISPKKASKRKRIPTESEDLTEEENKQPSRRRSATKKLHIEETGTDSEETLGGAAKRGRQSRQSAVAANKALAQVQQEDEDTSDVSSLESTPKRPRGRPKKSETPTRQTPGKSSGKTPGKTPGRKKGTKLASIFMKVATKKEESDSDVEIIMTEVDKEKLKIRRAFLMSGVPEEVRKQQQTNVAVQLSDFPPFPQISHVQQIDEYEPVWSRLPPDLVLKDEEGICIRPSVNLFCKTNRQKENFDCSNIRTFKEHSSIKEEVLKLLLAEINTRNCTYPVKRTFRQLQARKRESEKASKETVTTTDATQESQKLQPQMLSTNSSEPSKKRKLDESVTPDVSARQRRKRRKDSESVMMVDSEEEENCADDEGRGERRRSAKHRLSRRRSSRGKASSEIEANNEQTTNCEAKVESNEPTVEPQPCKRELLWTEKYLPTKCKEVIGNSRGVDKLKTWLQDWKKLTDLEIKRLEKEKEKQAKKDKKKLIQDTNVKDKKASEWSDESDFEPDLEDDSESDYIPESDMDSRLCNTMLITGPHGIGKTAVVYALAQELGYKVFEVNASSKRGGRQVLAQLQEATQSHQVTNKNMEDVFSTILSGASIKPKEEEPKLQKPQEKKALPTAFNNLFNKGKAAPSSPIKERGKKAKGEETSPVKRKPGRPSRRKSSDDVIFVKEEGSPGKKKTTNGKDKEKKKPHPKISLVHQDSEGSSKKGLDLSSCSLILFEEADLVLEEDKGFWAAIQTFMNTTKRPIILTTTDQTFRENFDSKCELRMECLNLSMPSLVNTATYLQLICLAENMRTNFHDMFSLAERFGGDIRQCVLLLQLWGESGGSAHPRPAPLLYRTNMLRRKNGNVTEDEGSQNNMSSTQLSSNPPINGFTVENLQQIIAKSEDSESEFEITNQSRLARNCHFRRPIIEDDSSMDSFAGSPVKVIPSGGFSSLGQILEEDSQHSNSPLFAVSVGVMAVNSRGLSDESNMCNVAWREEYPKMHTDCLNSFIGLQRSSVVITLLPKEGNKSESEINVEPTLLKKLSSSINEGLKLLQTFLDHKVDLLHHNLITLLQLPTKVTPLYSYTKFMNQEHTVQHQLKRIKNNDDLFDSEGDSSDTGAFASIKSKTAEKTDKTEDKISDKLQVKEAGSLHMVVSNRKRFSPQGNKLIVSSLDTVSRLYDDFSYCDSYLSLPSNSDGISNCSSSSRLRFRLNYECNFISPGQLEGARVDDSTDKLWNEEQQSEISARVQLGSLEHANNTLKNVIKVASGLDEINKCDVLEALTVPIERENVSVKFSQLSAVQSSLQQTYRSAAKNVFNELNPKSRKDARYDSIQCTCTILHKEIVTEYMPVLRTICKTEKLKEESKTKRRFLHYFDSQHLSLRKSTLDTLCTTFT